MSEQFDYIISRIDENDFVVAGETKEIRYKIENLTDKKLTIKDFGVSGDFITIGIFPPESLQPRESAEFSVIATVPEDYDFHEGLRPQFVGIIQKWIV